MSSTTRVPSSTSRESREPPIERAIQRRETARESGSTAVSAFREDVEGLRAIAILLVVVYHAGASVLGGGYVGVDVFFVISGFLITTKLFEEAERTGRISITRFYGRRIARLLPAATLVIVVTLIGAWLWLPSTRLKGIAFDSLLAAGYGLNFRLATEGIDYLAAAQAPSPLRHFWSLAVEEQFYLAWPVVLCVASLIWVRRGNPKRGIGDGRRPSRVSLAITLVLIIAGSFAYGLRQTTASAPWAYFGTASRAWELCVGALIAACAPWIRRMPYWIAVPLGPLGLSAIVVSGCVLTVDTPFPGTAAALPVGGAALIIAAGCVPRRTPLMSLLGVGVLRGIGRVSYSWYLWHWPLLMIVPAALGIAPDVDGKLFLASWGLALAAVTYATLEHPVRTWRSLRLYPWRSIAMGAGLSASVAALAAVAIRSLPPVSGHGRAVQTANEITNSSAASRRLVSMIVHSGGTRDVPVNLTPALELAHRDRQQPYRDGCDPGLAESRVNTACQYGERTSNFTVVLFGDSHAGHWFSALNRIAIERRWRLVVVTKSACSAASARIYLPELKRAYTECVEWRTKALDFIGELRPNLVVMSSNGHGGMPIGGTGDPDEAWTRAWLTTARRVARAAKRVVMLSDTPWPRDDAPECVAEHIANARACASTPARSIPNPRRRTMVAEALKAQGVKVVDPTPWFCAANTCPVIVGNILVYKDGSHLSSAYSEMLSPLLAEQL